MLTQKKVSKPYMTKKAKVHLGIVVSKILFIQPMSTPPPTPHFYLAFIAPTAGMLHASVWPP